MAPPCAGRLQRISRFSPGASSKIAGLTRMSAAPSCSLPSGACDQAKPRTWMATCSAPWLLTCSEQYLALGASSILIGMTAIFAACAGTPAAKTAAASTARLGRPGRRRI
ncbi:hypothetical protein GGQ97_000172 [Sphingomonas kaistensis]|uniref:Uncharacterized protein n=1 Tax=Sphingomonas kaistensis TaxID=298708 RepID=A0A7X5Y397_9SPHN|nr:hypothetical protein [Sphingomonas kaistensis]NJC04379.1 hypothetical protein [Sphingomonas kaistensis]